MAEPNLIPPIVGAGLWSGVAAAALFVALGWPRGRVTHRYGLFVAAPAKAVWDSYFVHINKADYRPGTRLLSADVVAQAPLSVRVSVQHDILAEPQTTTIVYDLWQPYERYRLHDEKGSFVEEGTFTAEPGGGTRLDVTITGERMRGFVMPWIAQRRVRRNQRALKDLCEGRPTLPPRAPLPAGGRWQTWVLLLLFGSLFVPVPWPLQLALGVAGVGIAALWLWRCAQLARRV